MEKQMSDTGKQEPQFDVVTFPPAPRWLRAVSQNVRDEAAECAVIIAVLAVVVAFLIFA